MDDTIVASTPNPQISAMAFMLLRYVVAFLSAVGVVHGTVSDSALMMAASALVGIGTLLWATWERIQQARHTHATAIASASAASPVQPAK